MLPAFRSNRSAIAFCSLLIFFLLLPVFDAWIGHPPREEAYAAMSGEVGPVGAVVREIFHDHHNADIVFLGSSLVRAGVDFPMLANSLAEHLHRPAGIDCLALNWQGLDLQYFLLKDYLATHHPALLIWNLPVPGSRRLEPYVEAYRWVRFGEDAAIFRGLPWRYRLALYSDMVLGAPRELYAHLRPSRLSPAELSASFQSERSGYYGAPFVPASADEEPMPSIALTLEEPPYPQVKVKGAPLSPYERHFAEAIIALAKANHVKVVFLHIPIDAENQSKEMPELASWPELLRTNAPMIGVSSAEMFSDEEKPGYKAFYRDQHMNRNGSMLFTRDITPAVLKSFDEAAAGKP